jgi:hypothetical protein
MPAKHQRGSPVVDVDLSDYTIEGASVRSDRVGARYALTFGPVSDSMLATLEDAARLAVRLRLDVNSNRVIIDLSATERVGPASVRLSGHIVPEEAVTKKN